jgi:ribokinase
MEFEVSRKLLQNEMVCSKDYTMLPSGHAASQALACARMNERVALVGMVGADGLGLRIRHSLRRAGVITTGVGESEELSTGIRLHIQEPADNVSTVMIEGANSALDPEQIPDNLISEDITLLISTDIKESCFYAIFDKGVKNKAKVIININSETAPGSAGLSAASYVLIEFDMARLIYKQQSGKSSKDIGVLSRALKKHFATNVIVYDVHEAALSSNDTDELYATKIKDMEVVQKSGAGDAFCGTFSACVHAGVSVQEAMDKALASSALCAAEPGGMDSYAYQDTIEQALEHLEL